ncbi:hypothetical protein MACK_003698 [Theileria orientalis]|uniref:Uncharacterized protein n=1 Tax=Theileria orientalis TaxID=68886 RepID=A0A976SIP0_THEOR|nr:hypothetical protein MACK_003698 [Theileria orientalis]
MQSRTVFFGQNNPQDANRMIDLSKMAQNEGQHFSDSDAESRARRGRSGQITSIIKQVSLDDGSEMEVEEVMSDNEFSRRRRKGDGRAVAAPLETDNEGAANRSARGPQSGGFPLLSPGSPQNVKAKSTVKHVSLSDGSEMEVEEVMSDNEFSRRRRKGDGRAVAAPFETDNEGGVSRMAKSKTSNQLETDNEGGAPRTARSQPLEIPLQSDTEVGVSRMARAKTSIPLETDSEGRTPRAARSQPLEIPLQSDAEGGVARMSRAKTAIPLETDNEGGVPRAARSEPLDIPLQSDSEAGVSRTARAKTAVPLETDNEGGISRMARAKTSIPLETDNEGNAPRSARGHPVEVPLQSDIEGGVSRMARAKTAVPLETDNEGGISRMARAKTTIPLETDNEGNAPRSARGHPVEVPLQSDIEGGVSRMARAKTAIPLETDNEGNAPRSARSRPMDLPLQSDIEGHAPRTMRSQPIAVQLETDDGAGSRTARQPRQVPFETESDGKPRRKSVLSIPLESEAEGDRSRAGSYRGADQEFSSPFTIQNPNDTIMPNTQNLLILNSIVLVLKRHTHTPNITENTLVQRDTGLQISFTISSVTDIIIGHTIDIAICFQKDAKLSNRTNPLCEDIENHVNIGRLNAMNMKNPKRNSMILHSLSKSSMIMMKERCQE